MSDRRPRQEPEQIFPHGPRPGGRGPDSPRPDPSQPLEEVRGELQRLGYLDHRMERFLLQDALRSRPALGTLLVLALKVALVVGGGLALVLVFVLAIANGTLERTPFDLLPLTLHLMLPAILGAGAGFLALCGALVLLIEVYHVRRIEAWCFGVALLAGGVALGLVLWRGRELVEDLSTGWLVALAALAVAGAFFLVKILYDGLLALAIRLTDLPPQVRLFSRRWLVAASLLAAFLVAVPVVLSARGPADPAAPVWVPRVTGERVLLVGVDGVLAEELDYLLERGELPVLARLAEEGAVGSYRREPQAPAAFWTTVATGLAPSEHGVTTLDSFRPLGVETPLARTGPLRLWWSRVAVPLGLAEYRPVLASRRQAHAVWDLAARGGYPVTLMDWWSTYPAEALAGVMVAHGAYGLLAQDTPGAVAPEAREPELARLAEAVRREGLPRELRAILGEGEGAAAFDQRALAPDRFHRRAFRELLGPEVRLGVLYLSALDLAADGFRGGPLAYGDLLRRELEAVDGLLGEEVLPAAGREAEPAETGFDTVLVVFDPGRRLEHGAWEFGDGKPGADPEGRVLIWRRDGGCAPGTRPGGEPRPGPGGAGSISPGEVAAAALRALGLPQSAELPEPPAACRWSEPVARVDAFGRRDGATSIEGGEEYLENLRSLGYI